MILDIVPYGHPALRAKGRRIEKVDEATRELAADMLETMYEADGVGLAAQQVGVPVQMCVIDVTGVKDRPSALRIGGKVVDLAPHMPLVLINPTVETSGPAEVGTEGCLSFPGLRVGISRPSSVKVTAMGLEGEAIEFEASGLLSRAVQHEHDHLHGLLFIDRMNADDRRALADAIEDIANNG